MQNWSVSGSGFLPTCSTRRQRLSSQSKSSAKPHVIAQWIVRLITGGQSRIRLCVPSMSCMTWVIVRRLTGLTISIRLFRWAILLSSSVAMLLFVVDAPALYKASLALDCSTVTVIMVTAMLELVFTETAKEQYEAPTGKLAAPGG